MLNEQLKELIRREAETLYDILNEKAQEIDSYDFGLPMANRQTQPIVDCLTQYAEKWQAEVAERSEARKLLDEVFRKHEAGLLPDRFIYEKIKAFLFPTPKTNT